MPSALPKHPFGLRYIYYRVFFAVLRSIIYLLKWNSFRNLKIPDGVVRKRILIPSRERGRSIKVDVYKPSGYDRTKPNAVVINFHGCVPEYCRLFHWLTLRFWFAVRDLHFRPWVLTMNTSLLSFHKQT